MRLLVTGGTGVLGRALRPLAEAAGHEEVYVQPTVTFVYPPDAPVSEDTPVREVLPILRSALAAEQQAERFARAGGWHPEL
jgi:nucleoside-diphosphate-sugar epimerase